MTPAPDPIDPLLETFDRMARTRNGVPDPELAADRERCPELLRRELGPELAPDGIRCSVLGPAWTEVYDVHLRRRVDPARLVERGWLPLDRVVGPHRLRSSAAVRWAVVEDDRVLAGVHLRDAAAGSPVEVVLDRCRERSEVRLREVLELRELRRRGAQFPTDSAALRVAAEIESGLGGRRLAPWATGRTTFAPAPLPARRRHILVAVSGVDGSGKSTLRQAVAEGLGRAGVPVSTVWVRPGMGLGRLTSLAVWGKRLLRQDATPGIRTVSTAGTIRLASRRGAVGWAWALLVTGSFLLGVWRQHRASSGVVLYDRHLVDALATLDFAYDGVDLRLHRWLILHLLPRADVGLYLDVPAEVSVARKPDDVIGEHAVRRQLAGYTRWLALLPPTERLDATRPPRDIAAHALRVVTGVDAR